MKTTPLNKLIMLCMVLFSATLLHSQTWMNSYNISPTLPGGWKEVSKVIKTSNNEFVAIGYATNASLNDEVIVGRFDAAGTPLWTRNYGWPALSYSLKGLDISESPNNFFVMSGSIRVGTGTPQNWIMKIDPMGTPHWADHWASFETRAIIHTHDPSYSNHVVAVSKEMSGTVGNTAIHLVDLNTGAMVNSGIVFNGNNEETMDVVEDQVRGGYWVLSNMSSPNQRAVVRFIDYALSSNAAREFIVSGGNQRFDGVQLALDGNDLYVLGNMLNTPAGGLRSHRPALFKIDLTSTSWIITSRTLLESGLSPGIASLGTDLVLTNKPGSEGVLVTGYKTQNGVLHPWLWATDRLLNTTGYYDHSSLAHPGGFKYTSPCPTSSADFYMATGRDHSGNNIILSRVTHDGQTDCSDAISYSDEPSMVSILNSITLNSYTGIPQNTVSPTSNFGWPMNSFCGCAQPSSKNTFIYAVNGSYDPTGWNGGDYNYGNGESYMFVTDQSTPNSSAQLISISTNGQRNFIKQYSSPMGPVMGGDVKRAANGDFILTGFVMNTRSLFIMRTDNTGNVLWSNYYPDGLAPSHLRIAETNPSGDIVVVGMTDFNNSGNSTQNLLQVRLRSSGTQIYYLDQNMKVNGVTRQYFGVLGVTATTGDDGYAVCGTTGHDWDYMAAYVFKFDGAGTSGTRDWEYEFLAQTPGGCYDLNNPNCRAYAVFYDVQEVRGGDLVAVGMTSDLTQYGDGATFVDALLVRLDNAGNLLAHKQYADPTAMQNTIFHGVNYNSALGSLVVTGYTQDKSNGVLRHLFSQIDFNSLNVMGMPYLYGNGNNNQGYRIYEGNNSNFVMIGLGDDNGAILPTLTSVDLNGNLGCETPYLLKESTPLHINPTIDIGPAQVELPYRFVFDDVKPCREFLDWCPNSQRTAGTTSILEIQGAITPVGLSVYPSPAGNLISIPLNPQGTIQVTTRVYDMQGRLLIEEARLLQKGTSINALDVSQLNSGPYFIRLVDNQGNVYPALKFVKE